MISASNYAKQVGLAICQARQQYLSGDHSSTLLHYGRAVQLFTGYCAARGVLPAAQMSTLAETLTITEDDNRAFPLRGSCESLRPLLEMGLRDNKKVIIIAGASAVGKNTFADYLVQGLNQGGNAASLVDIDGYNFVIRSKLTASKPLSRQLAEDDVLALEPFVGAVARLLGRGQTVVLPVYEGLMGRLPTREWPTQLVQLSAKRPGVHGKVWRWLFFQAENFEEELAARNDAYYLDITAPSKQGQRVAPELGPEYTIDQRSGKCLGKDGRLVFHSPEMVNINEEDPFFNALDRRPADALVRDHVANRKMLGMLRFWEKLAEREQLAD